MIRHFQRPLILSLVVLLVGVGGLIWVAWERWTHEDVLVSSPQPNPWAPLFDPARSVEERFAEAANLSVAHDLEQLKPLLLRWGPQDGHHEQAQGDYFVFNEICRSAKRLATFSPVASQGRYTRGEQLDFLSSVLRDARMTPVIRDYAAQHMVGVLLSEAPPAACEQDAAALMSLCHCLQDPDLVYTSIPGTTLNALRHLAQARPELVRDREEGIAKAVEAMLRSPGTPKNSRISAIQFAVHLQSSACLPALRDLVRSPETDDALAMAAASALGRLGTVADVPDLELLAQRGTFASPVARQAISTIQSH